MTRFLLAVALAGGTLLSTIPAHAQVCQQVCESAKRDVTEMLAFINAARPHPCIPGSDIFNPTCI